MKKLALLAGLALTLAGCASQRGASVDDFAPVVADADSPITTGSAEASADNAGVTEQQPAHHPATVQPKPWSQPAATTANTTQVKYPTATPVTGKPSIVRSPYAPYAGPVDVRECTSGQQVYCPYTGKIFIVP
ncbi:MAG: hypothetical protein LBK76_00550 [Verrucomicrobiales bacterium]|jgi:hypothetical protein|nr:hypothetical protein [Verrucomicrobiales bacterium]